MKLPAKCHVNLLIELEEVKALLKYVYEQTMGDVLRSSIEDDEMLMMYLSAGKMREIAQIVEEK